MKTPILSFLILALAGVSSVNAMRTVSPQELLEESLLSVRPAEMVKADQLHSTVFSSKHLPFRTSVIAAKYPALRVLIDSKVCNSMFGKQERQDVAAGIKYGCFLVAAVAEARKEKYLEGALITLPAADMARAIAAYKSMPRCSVDAMADHVISRYRGYGNPFGYDVFMRLTNGKVSEAFLYGYGLAMGSLVIAAEY